MSYQSFSMAVNAEEFPHRWRRDWKQQKYGSFERYGEYYRTMKNDEVLGGKWKEKGRFYLDSEKYSSNLKWYK